MWENLERIRSASLRSVCAAISPLIVLLLLFASGCGSRGEGGESSNVYSELGGVEGLRPIVDELTWRLITDDLLASAFLDTKIAGLKEQILVYLCAASDGPCLDAGVRPLIAFSGSPSAAARRVIEHLRASALARGARAETVDRLVKRLERDIRGFIGPPGG